MLKDRMKILNLECEETPLGRKPKRIRADNKLISKVGNGLYYLDEVKAVNLNVHLKNGTSISFKRSEDEDRFDRIKSSIDEEDD